MARCLGKVFSNELFEFCKTVFEKTGVPKEDAEIVSEHLVKANLRGVDSHGVFVRLHHYVSAIKQGVINPRPNIKLVKETSGACLMDGDNGLGPLVAMKATELAIKKARSNGVCVVGVKNTGHVGMLARYTLKAAEEKMIGFAATSSPPIVVPWGGAKPVFGTNPFSIGFPVDGSFPIIVDMATSTVAAGKIAVYASKGDPGLRAARELSKIPVIGPAEASISMSFLVGDRYGLIVPLDRDVPTFRALTVKYGFNHRLSSIVPLNVPVLELGKNIDLVKTRLEDACSKAVEEGAEVLILGCMSLAFILADELVKDSVPVPVLNPAKIGVRVAEMFAQFRIGHSRISYPIADYKKLAESVFKGELKVG